MPHLRALRELEPCVVLGDAEGELAVRRRRERGYGPAMSSISSGSWLPGVEALSAVSGSSAFFGRAGVALTVLSGFEGAATAASGVRALVGVGAVEGAAETFS